MKQLVAVVGGLVLLCTSLTAYAGSENDRWRFYPGDRVKIFFGADSLNPTVGRITEITWDTVWVRDENLEYVCAVSYHEIHRIEENRNINLSIVRGMSEGFLIALGGYMLMHVAYHHDLEGMDAVPYVGLSGALCGGIYYGIIATYSWEEVPKLRLRRGLRDPTKDPTIIGLTIRF